MWSACINILLAIEFVKETCVNTIVAANGVSAADKSKCASRVQRHSAFGKWGDAKIGMH